MKYNTKYIIKGSDIIINQNSNSLVNTLDQWFSQAPSLPTNAKEALVKYIPIIALIFGVIGIIEDFDKP